MKKDSFGLPDPGLSSVKRDSFLAFMRYFSRFETFPVFAGQAPRSLPGERRKSRSPHEALQDPSRPKDKDVGHFRGSEEDLSLRTVREDPPPGRSLLQEPPEGLQGGPDGRLGLDGPDRGGRGDCLCGMEKGPIGQGPADLLPERFLGRENVAKKEVSQKRGFKEQKALHE